jgi:hypothetical protein
VYDRIQHPRLPIKTSVPCFAATRPFILAKINDFELPILLLGKMIMLQTFLNFLWLVVIVAWIYSPSFEVVGAAFVTDTLMKSACSGFDFRPIDWVNHLDLYYSPNIQLLYHVNMIKIIED